MTKITVNVCDPTPSQKKFIVLVLLSRGYSGVQIEQVSRRAITKGVVAGFRHRMKKRKIGIDLYIYNLLKECIDMDMPLIPNPNGYMPDRLLPAFNRRLKTGIVAMQERLTANMGPPSDTQDEFPSTKKRSVLVRKERVLSSTGRKLSAPKVQKKIRVDNTESLIEYESDIPADKRGNIEKEIADADTRSIIMDQRNSVNRIEPETRIESMLGKTGVRELPEGYDPYNPDRPYLPTTMINTQDNTCRQLQKNDSDPSKVLWCNAFIPVEIRKDNPSCCLMHRKNNGLTSYRPRKLPSIENNGGALPEGSLRAKK